MLEVSSPGLLRPFKKDRDFEKNLGGEVELKLYKPVGGEKEWTGILKAFDADTVVLELEGEDKNFPRSGISLIRKYIDFSDL